MKTYIANIGGLPGWIFDGGVRNLSKKMNRLSSDIESKYFACWGWRGARDDIIELFNQRNLKYVVLNVHSWGCYEAEKIINDLKPLGIKIRYIAAMDPTAGPKMEIQDNVEFVDEFWAGIGVPQWQRNNVPDGSHGGKYIYLPGSPSKGYRKFEYPHKEHIALSGDKEVHEIIKKRVRELCLNDK